jgi:hypothetical protein
MVTRNCFDSRSSRIRASSGLVTCMGDAPRRRLVCLALAVLHRSTPFSSADVRIDRRRHGGVTCSLGSTQDSNRPLRE